ncbi:amidohydrolase 2 [Phanerochaete sordida]|uniref:Amidohydrolase 2 n=1 Tax=Phanerochaete sordida TaxID=48140 RepID=A0A9P3GIM1_9APHY|nr:amidohydrolase 2 [Phanerochaete sordida]
MAHVGVFLLSSLFAASRVRARVWNNTGVGAIAFEEAWSVPELIHQADFTVPPVNQTLAELEANLLDVHDQRLAHMDATGIDFMVLSCASPCVQGITDPTNASTTAISLNDELARQISNNTQRFGAFAALAMHDPAVAAAELRRTVTQLGFLGALINDYQQAGDASNETFIFYDQPEFDVFWETVVDLDVPVYLHPRVNPPPVSTLLFDHAKFLIGPAQEFASTLSTHILGLCTNGVFDRFPNLTIISGHLGERIPSDLVRIDDQLARQVVAGMPMQKNVTFYFQNNILETTSGNFATDLVKFHASQIGLARILYSVDYPYVTMEEGAAWLDDEVPTFLDNEQALALKRGRAIEVLKLNK